LRTMILQTKEQGTGHKIYLDILRVIATLFVICVHTVSLAATMVSPQCTEYYILEILNFIFLSCNLLFVMISGALLLSVRSERCDTFFAKRFVKVLVPMVIYYILYVCAKEGIVWLYPDHWLSMLRRILTGAPVEAPHFWLVYVLLLLYVLTPFLRWIVQHIPDAVFSGVIAVVFLVNALDTYLPAAGIASPFSPVVDSFAGVFLLGYFLAGAHSRRLENLLILGGVVSSGISCYLILYTVDYGNYIYQNAPTMMFFASAIFLAVKRLAGSRTKEHFFIRLTSRYSYSILLIHWGMLHFVTKQLLHVDVLYGGIVGGCLLMISVTFLLSLAGGMILDHTLIWLILFLLKKFVYSVRKLRSEQHFRGV